MATAASQNDKGIIAEGVFIIGLYSQGMRIVFVAFYSPLGDKIIEFTFHGLCLIMTKCKMFSATIINVQDMNIVKFLKLKIGGL
ncbi:CLUMA_CG001078, isoform A [Clunio marinus]|uniref:CLUMA_CG001078, isoform A n=1 Tax=Clunio marinus TaxID=568069 RepID=A0A1J1HIP9_9DIPT|nr:CLUMA_CG001078, isoform A [Clunio marinus]